MPESTTRRRVLLQESDFAEALGARGEELVRLANELLAAGPGQWTERRYDLLYRLSTELETFLDDHGARANRTFFRIRECVAVIRSTRCNTPGVRPCSKVRFSRGAGIVWTWLIRWSRDLHFSIIIWLSLPHRFRRPCAYAMEWKSGSCVKR